MSEDLREFAIVQISVCSQPRHEAMTMLREELHLLGLNVGQLSDEEIEHWISNTASVVNLLGVPIGASVKAFAETLASLRKLEEE